MSAPANDKGSSIDYGDSKEVEFIEEITPNIPVNVQMNPEKEDDPTAIDYICNDTDTLCDLKTRRTPFFTAGRKYDIDPQYAVTFNTDAFARYSRADGDVVLLFWVKWNETEGYGTTVEDLHGVWAVTVDTVRTWVDDGLAKQHTYQTRSRSDEHSTASYLLNLGWMTPVTVYTESHSYENPDWVEELVLSE